MKRLRNAWRALFGRWREPDIYTYDSTPRIVQLQYYQDKLIGLTNEGDMYEIRFAYSGAMYSVQLLMHNPIRRY